MIAQGPSEPGHPVLGGSGGDRRLARPALEQGLRNLLDHDGLAGNGGALTTVAAAPGADGSPADLTEQVLGHGLIRTL
jgi:hypothetical protein